MGFLNSNNFVRWGGLVNTDPVMTEDTTPGDIIGWNESDVAPIGDNETAWSYLGGKAGVIDGATESTKGLSQEVKIRKGYSYMVNWSISENLYGDTNFYIYAIGGSKKQLIATQLLGASVDEVFTYGFEADDNYTKIVICAVAVAGSGISAYVDYFRLTEIGF